MATPRYSALDALRAASMLFIILWHATLPYAPMAEGRWPVTDPGASNTWNAITWITMGVTLRIFFVMAGFFARFVYERVALRGFAENRIRRILVPLLIAAPLFHLSTRGTFGYAPLHLWFLQDLFVISMVVAAAVWAAGKWLAPERLRMLDVAGSRIMGSAAAPLIAAIPTALVIYGANIPGEDPSGIANNFNLDPIKVLFYALFFCFGWFLHRNQGLIQRFERRATAFLVLGVLIRLSSAVLFTLPLASRAIPMVAATACYTWCMVLGSIGLFSRVFQSDRPLLRYVADASYFFYIAHPIPMVIIQKWAIQYALPSPLKYGLTVLTTLSILVVAYEYLVRYTPIGTLLNGRRERPSESRARAWSLRPLSAEPAPTGTGPGARDGATIASS